MRRAMVAIALMTGLSACGSNAVTGSAAPGPPTATSPVPVTAAVGSAPVDAAALCAFLETDLPAVEAAASNSATSAQGTNVGAETQFAIDYASWISDDPAARKLADATQLDAVTTARCPEVRARLVKALGASSFSAALGS